MCPKLQTSSCWFEVKLKRLEGDLLLYSSHFVLCISTTAPTTSVEWFIGLKSSLWLHQRHFSSLPMIGIYKYLRQTVFSVGFQAALIALMMTKLLLPEDSRCILRFQFCFSPCFSVFLLNQLSGFCWKSCFCQAFGRKKSVDQSFSASGS